MFTGNCMSHVLGWSPEGFAVNCTDAPKFSLFPGNAPGSRVKKKDRCSTSRWSSKGAFREINRKFKVFFWCFLNAPNRGGQIPS